MKYRCVVPFLFFICAAAFSQQPVKINLMSYFDKVTVPPSTAKEAYQKCLVKVPGRDDQVVADSIFKPLIDELQRIQMDISTPPNSPQAELMKKMQDPEFQKKMQTMSEDEKMKMAMEMNQAMGATPGPMKPEPQSVINCMAEIGKLNETAAGQMENLSGNAETAAKHDQDLQAKHDDIDAWQDAEIKKLPDQPGGGEGGGGPDPKAEYTVKMSAMKKHLAIVDDELKRIDKTWAEQLANSKKLFDPYEKSLEKTHYGSDAKNQMSKTNLSTGQTLLIGSISSLISESQKAYQDAADWYSRLVTLQKSIQQ